METIALRIAEILKSNNLTFADGKFTSIDALQDGLYYYDCAGDRKFFHESHSILVNENMIFNFNRSVSVEVASKVKAEFLAPKTTTKMTKSEIMKLAHSFKKEGLTMSESLKKAWSIAKGN